MTLTQQLRTAIDHGVDQATPLLLDLSHRIHSRPELAFAEFDSSADILRTLHERGFRGVMGLGDLATAFDATVGRGDLHLALLAEYDALPDLGHACGHNIIAAAAVGAAFALAPEVDDLGITLHVIGTPAEESGGGKEILLRAGAFDAIAAVAMVHPGPANVVEPKSLAIAEFTADYRGRSAHAAAAPHKGINAADAVTIAQVAIGLLRQHLAPGQQVHGIVTNGGSAPNVVPDHASVHYLVRAENQVALEDVAQRMIACFTAGAVASGAELDVREVPPRYLELNADAMLADVGRTELAHIGRHEQLLDGAMGSTDMGNLMVEIPGIHPLIQVGDGTTGLHQVDFAELCVEPTGDDAVIAGAKMLAGIFATVASHPLMRARLSEAQRRRRDGSTRS